MPLAQRAILDCHALAKEISDRADQAVCHAVGQACAVVHTAGHAMGYPLYDLTSILFRLGMEDGVKAVEARKQEYIDRLLYWGAHVGNIKAHGRTLCSDSSCAVYLRVNCCGKPATEHLV